MYYLANLRNKVLINQILPDKLFKPKRRNKKKFLTLNQNRNSF